MFNKLIILAFALVLQSCSTVDDYLLGKDNTPKPQALEPIKSKEKLNKKWSVPVGKQKTTSYLKLKPILVNNIIFTADANGTVQALDRINGKALWTKKLDQGLVSGPTVAAGLIALGTDASSIVVLKQTDGSEVWQKKVSGDVLSRPVISRNKLIAKTIDGNLYGFNLTTGEKLWVSDHGAPSLILKASSSPVIHNNVALVGYSDGKMDAVDLETGRLLWQRSIAYATGGSDVERLVDIDADPIIRGNIVYLANYQGYVGAFSLTTGDFI